MGMPIPGIGIVFNIDDLGGGFYGYQAWRIFMQHIDPNLVPGSVLFEGDTRETLNGNAREYCIAIYGQTIDLGKIYDIFAKLTEKSLRRFIRKPHLDAEPLAQRGRIDAGGFFVTDEWSRIDHDLCKENRWKYRPQKVTVDLDDELKEELEELMGEPLRKWWQFWR